jgi:hypothetical protein
MRRSEELEEEYDPELATYLIASRMAEDELKERRENKEATKWSQRVIDKRAGSMGHAGKAASPGAGPCRYQLTILNT